MRASERTVGRKSVKHGVVALLVSVLAAVVIVATPGVASAQGASTSAVTVVHGLRGQLVDVYLDGELVLKAFQPDRITDPITVPAGVHKVDLRPAGTPATDPPKATASPDLPAGRVSVVAYFAADGTWTMSVFSNSVETLAPGAGQITFRDTSAVSPVLVQVGDQAAPTSLAMGAEFSKVLPAASYAVGVTTTDNKTLVPSDNVAVGAGEEVILYLVGQGENVTWLTQRVGAATAAPSVPAGNSGLATEEAPMGNGAWVLPLAFALLAAWIVLAATDLKSGSVDHRRVETNRVVRK